MPYVTAYNTTDRPVLIDDEGRTLGGGEWGPVLTTEEPARMALDAGTLVKVAEPKNLDDVTPEARSAFERTSELEEARKSGDTGAIAEAAEQAAATPTKGARRAAARSEEG